MGVLIDNAIEAVNTQNVVKKIIFALKDSKPLEISVKNPVKNISNNDIERFYQNGYSTKGEKRGLGLSKIKEYQKQYKYNIFTHLTNTEEEQWIEFKIVFDN